MNSDPGVMWRESVAIARQVPCMAPKTRVGGGNTANNSASSTRQLLYNLNDPRISRHDQAAATPTTATESAAEA